MVGDKVRVEVFVAVPLEDCFRIFTQEIDQWWRRGPAYRVASGRAGTMRLEPALGGKLVEHFGDGKSRDVGTITT